MDLDFESLKDIVSGIEYDHSHWREILFEGIMEWIMHDAKNRKIYMKDLLNCINVTMLSSDYFLKYVGTIADDENDDGIVKDLMSCYHNLLLNPTCNQNQETKPLVEYSKQALVVIESPSSNSEFLRMQFYNFTEKKWSALKQTRGTKVNSEVVLLNNALYFVTQDSGVNHLKMFDLTTKQITTLISSDYILPCAALGICENFLYLCGGYQLLNSSAQCLRYDTQRKCLEHMRSMQRRRSRGQAIYYQNCLYILGGYTYSLRMDPVSWVEKYDPGTSSWIMDFYQGTRKWSILPSMCRARSDFGVAVLGKKLYACGGLNHEEYAVFGHITNSVEVYDQVTNCWQMISGMNKKRSKFIVVAHDGKLLAIGGDREKTVEVYDPSKDQWQIYEEMTSGLNICKPLGGLVSDSCLIDAN